MVDETRTESMEMLQRKVVMGCKSLDTDRGILHRIYRLDHSCDRSRLVGEIRQLGIDNITMGIQ